MLNNKINSLLLTLIVLFSVLIGTFSSGGGSSSGGNHENSKNVAMESKPDTVNLTATAVETTLPQTGVSTTIISAASALAKDLFSSAPAYSLNVNQQWPVASLTKLVTAVVAEEGIAKEAKITVSAKAVATEGAAGNLIVGGIYSRDELLFLMLTMSSNDAAAALAEYFDHRQDEAGKLSAGYLGKEQFLEEMNAKITALGMYNTRFFDPAGLSPLNQSTISDLEKLVSYIYSRHPDIFATTRQKEGNTHPFAKWDNFLGGKTGFLDEASGNLISLFNYPPVGGRPLLIIVLGSEDRAKDTEVLYQHFSQ